MRPRGGMGMRMIRAGMRADPDSRGYLESGARPSEVTPGMRMNNAGAAQEQSPGLNPMSKLNDKMNGV